MSFGGRKPGGERADVGADHPRARAVRHLDDAAGGENLHATAHRLTADLNGGGEIALARKSVADVEHAGGDDRGDLVGNDVACAPPHQIVAQLGDVLKDRGAGLPLQSRVSTALLVHPADQQSLACQVPWIGAARGADPWRKAARMCRTISNPADAGANGRTSMKTTLKLIACTAASGAALAMPLAAQDQPKIATVVKIAGIQWFNRMEEGVKQFAADTGDDAFLVGPAQADPQQQVALLEDMIAQGVNALAVVPMSPEALEPVLGRAMEQGIAVITHEAAAPAEHQLGHRGVPERGLRRQPDGKARHLHGRRGRVRGLRRLADLADP